MRTSFKSIIIHPKDGSRIKPLMNHRIPEKLQLNNDWKAKVDQKGQVTP